MLKSIRAKINSSWILENWISASLTFESFRLSRWRIFKAKNWLVWRLNSLKVDQHINLLNLVYMLTLSLAIIPILTGHWLIAPLRVPLITERNPLNVEILSSKGKLLIYSSLERVLKGLLLKMNTLLCSLSFSFWKNELMEVENSFLNDLLNLWLLKATYLLSFFSFFVKFEP